MASDAEWVEGVRRWYFAGRTASGAQAHDADGTATADDTTDPIGYEAADPVLQAPHWPDPLDADASSARPSPG